jgi:hypothetical protein
MSCIVISKCIIWLARIEKLVGEQVKVEEDPQKWWMAEINGLMKL